MRYTPFDNKYDELTVSNLKVLWEVSEGWYVEYKSELPNEKALAKSLSSFANQYGGWLILGVKENRKTLTAESFPGIQQEQITEALESLRNAAKDIVRPQVVYQFKVLEGPVEEIGLDANRCVVVVRVPEGSHTPYIHNDGRIYIRIGDSSSPIPAKDRSTFDLLFQRGKDRRTHLSALIEKSPELSEWEEESCFLHLIILSDPYETMGHWYQGTYEEFCSTMSGASMPFDNIYTSPEGFVARQAKGNKRYHRLFTWEFSRNCNSFVTVPIPTLPSPVPYEYFGSNDERAWSPYSIGEPFVEALLAKDLEESRILNLNILLLIIRGIISRHRRIVGQANIRGPFYIKARIENVWRAIPFLDIEEYMTHINRFDFPIVQSSELMVPSGTSLDTFVFSPELEGVPDESDPITFDGPIQIWLEVMNALGIPGELLAKSAKALHKASIRESKLRRAQ